MPELLCSHPNCPVHEDVEVPFMRSGGHITWYCREHRGTTEFQPKRQDAAEGLVEKVNAAQDEILESTVRGNEVFSPEMAEFVKPMLEVQKDVPIRHIAGPYEGGVQQCTRCLKIIADDRNVYVRDGQTPPRGFAEGEVNNLGFGWYIGHDPEAVDCEPMDIVEAYEHDEGIT